MSLFSKSQQESKSNSSQAHQKLIIGDQKVYLNSRGLIPVILQRNNHQSNEVLDLVYMDREALQLSYASGELYVFRRSKQKIERLRNRSGKSVTIQQMAVCQNRRAILLNIRPENSENIVNSFIYKIHPSSDNKK